MYAFILIFIIIVCMFYSTRTVLSQYMESTRYRIEYPNINIGATQDTSENYSINTTLGQTAAGQFQSAGYIIKAGFQYFYSIIPFRFTISNYSINFGSIYPNTPSTLNTNLTVSFGSAYQYQVTAQEIGTLRISDGGNFIPDTTCNGGAQTCTETSAKIWDSTSAYGFGYNMSGNDIPVDFTDSTYYRPFSDRSLSESPAVIMSSANVGENRIATVTYKVNIPSTQESGVYTTIINYVATPGF